MNFLFLCTSRFLRPTTAGRRVANHVRLLSVSGARSGPSANKIRRQFIDYFTNKHNHRLIRSSSLVPFSDGTIAFVNAGMNQFKNVFLGTADRPCARAVNSQKCVRVGGKHNDLSVVGTDSYHHTFFEMLGNWSFGDYFKREACEMACDLLRTVYHIDMERVYVTYFGGDARLNLPADEECRDIWLSLGIPRERVLPFGARDNFWEMGNSGPCGPCTEIHLDLSDQYRDTASRRQYVNAGLPDLTEIWNIVFIQYNRSLEGDGGAIRNLPQRHVDTGMGLERLVAHLQGKLSNYDTDLFTPILQRIQQVTRKPAYSGCFNRTDSHYELDTAYRVLADHSRMITACLADGMFPSQNHKLRRVIRKSLALASGTFERPKLLEETIPVVVETLGEVYPEMGHNLSTVLQIIEHEQHSYDKLCSKRSAETAALLQRYPQLEESEVLDHAGLPGAIRELVETNASRLDGVKIHKMYDTYGLDEELLVKLGEMLKFSLDFRDYERYAGELKHGFKHELASRLEERLSAFQQLRDSIEDAQLKATHNERKYNYAYNAQKRMYEVAPCSTRVTLLLDDRARDLWHVVTERSNFYCESGGQQSDTGRLILPESNISIEVTSVNDHNGFIVHSIPKQPNVRLSIGDPVELQVDASRRTSLTLHHTATHLLNAIVRKIVPHPMCQRSSSVTEKGLRLELAISGDKLTLEQIAAIETEIRSVIDRNEPVSVQVCNASELDLTSVTIVPGETYPERGLRVISIGGGRTSQELCCGTHATGTRELQDFAITSVTQSKNGCFTFHAVAGPAAKKVHLLGTQIQNDVAQLQQDAEQNEGQEDITIIETRLQRLKSVLLTGTDNNMHLPYCIRQRCLEVIGTLYQKLKDRSRESLRELVDIEMRNLMEQRPADRDEHRFIVHFLECSIILDEVQLSKATRYCPDRPILVVSITDNQVKARATVPPAFVNERFNAQRWLALVAQEFKAQNPTAPKGQNPAEVCNMKARKVPMAHFETMLENALRVAERFAEENVPQMGRGPAQLKE